MTEIARRDDTAPAVLIPRYRDEFALVLPQHIDAGAFVQMALSALKRDDKLAQVARQNPASLIHALRDSARLGHLPGTEYYYLTPRFGKDPGVVGIEGYRGVVERMYRTGAVDAVHVELVRANDRFRFDPGSMDRPAHEVDWFGRRGDVLGAYAYAALKGGATSKVVVIGPEEIERAKSASSTASKSFSPWQSDYGAMVLKTAAHRLEPWVPTSAEYLAETMRARAAASRIEDDSQPVEPAPAPSPLRGVLAAARAEHVDTTTGEVTDTPMWDDPQIAAELAADEVSDRG